MKKNNVNSFLLIILFMAFGIGNQQLMAQRPGKNRPDRKAIPSVVDDSINSQGQRAGSLCRIPGLTDSQETKIKDSRIKMEKELIPLENLKSEKEAHLRTLNAEDNIDQLAIDKTIDEISALNANIAKLQNKHHQEVRSLLTEEQKVYFDSRPGPKSGKGLGYGPRHKKKQEFKRQPMRGPACRQL